MNFDMGSDETAPHPARPVKPGDVFSSKATGPKGKRYGTRYWLVVAVRETGHGNRSHHMLGLDVDGNVVSTVSYGGHVMEARERIGVVENFDQQKLSIRWER